MTSRIFIIELVSESHTRSEAHAKMQMWMWIANGVRVAWLIDPYTREAAVYRTGREPEVLQQPAVLEGDGPVAGFRLKMERLWG